MAQNRWTSPQLHKPCTWADSTAWNTGERSASGINNLQELQTQPHGRDGDDLCCLFADSPECVYTPPWGADTTTGWAWCSCPKILLVSYLPGQSPLLQGQAGSQPRCSNSICFYLGKSHSEKFTELTISILLLFLLVFSGILLSSHCLRKVVFAS